MTWHCYIKLAEKDSMHFSICVCFSEFNALFRVRTGAIHCTKSYYSSEEVSESEAGTAQSLGYVGH